MKIILLMAAAIGLGAIVPVATRHDTVDDSNPFTVADASIVFEGLVRDSETGRPIPGAEVFLAGTTHGARTDAGGRFYFEVNDEALVGADVALRIRLPGYKEAEMTVRVTGPTVRVDFSLTPAVIELDENVTDEFMREHGFDIRAYGVANEAEEARNFKTLWKDMDRRYFRRIDYTPGVSTTDIIARIVSRPDLVPPQPRP